jgi:oxygen-independent coproporphyrinogen-3 oxidase
MDHMSSELDVDTGLRVPAELLRRFDVAGPRYTSYPTADRWSEAYDADRHRRLLARRAEQAIHRPLSLYVHLPFCQSICYYCACNKVITRDHSRSARYVAYLERELEMQASLLGDARDVVQMHWGGGTPTFLSHEELAGLFQAVRRHLRLQDEGEYSIEIDPRTLRADTLALLRELGFNRLSFGVQDFDPEVQRAVHRLQDEQQTADAIAQARQLGFRSINVDLIYGLPKQNVPGFRRTLARVLECAPDRIALYSYAHLPAVFKPQRRIQASDLPSAEGRVELLSAAIRDLTSAGYLYIGMDHFARSDNELALALREGRLHRNFQGYSSHADSDLLGVGISAIGQLQSSYSQNVKTLEAYYAHLDRGVLPVARGIELTADDEVRRAAIQSLMCHSQVQLKAFAASHSIDFEAYFRDDLARLQPFVKAGLVHRDAQSFVISELGRFFVRNICMELDAYLRAGHERAGYSKAL